MPTRLRAGIPTRVGDSGGGGGPETNGQSTSHPWSPRTPQVVCQTNVQLRPSKRTRLAWMDSSLVRGHEEVPGYGQLRSPLVATKVPAFGHEKSSPLTEVST